MGLFARGGGEPRAAAGTALQPTHTYQTSPFLNPLPRVRDGMWQREIVANERREDVWASTFVEKVLVQRKKEFDNAWGTFR